MNQNVLLESRKEYLLDNFERALKEEWIEVYIQPVVRSSNGRVCKEEALARWDDPVFGVLNPNDFVPVLEDAGLIEKFDLYILEKVIQKMKRQVELGMYIVPTSINFSQLDFQTDSAVKKIDGIISKSGIKKDNFSFEISDNPRVIEKNNILSQLELLQKKGYGIEFDDFGSGDSSLLLADQIHFNTVKINISLTRQILFNTNAQIYITQLVNMARALGIETVVKGVENKEQVDFLRNRGCARLQGFYFSKPLSVKILEKFVENNEQFLVLENPKEADYYNAVDNVNLHEQSYVSDGVNGTEAESSIIPMAILEIDENELNVMRLNEECQDFLDKYFPDCKGIYSVDLASHTNTHGAYTLSAIRRCIKTDSDIVIEDKTPVGVMVNVMLKKIATNPETKRTAILFAIISVGDKNIKVDSLSYNYISRALSEDYVAMYFVNIETNRYVVYNSDGASRDVTAERNGEDFFYDASNNVNHKIYEDDLQMFNELVTKENILRNIEENGSFSITFRANYKDGFRYISFKAVQDRSDKKHIIIGINNVDNQIKRQEKFKALQEEKIYYSCIAALAGDIYAMYSVDLRDNSYTVYKSSQGDDYIGIRREEKDFFEETTRMISNVIYSEDLDGFCKNITKENIIDKATKNGSFEYEYRLIVDDKPSFFRYKAIIIKENDEEKLIVGLINIDAEVRKEKEYAENLHQAEDLAIKDGLTGVKNKNAYSQAEKVLEAQVAAGIVKTFAIAVFDLNGLKYVNDTYGHKVGDDFIKNGCKIICDAFPHSPVFRIGGDEFVVIIQGDAYKNVGYSMGYIEAMNHKNMVRGEVTIAAGMAKGDVDLTVNEVFVQADKNMYEKKKQMK